MRHLALSFLLNTTKFYLVACSEILTHLTQLRKKANIKYNEDKKIDFGQQIVRNK